MTRPLFIFEMANNHMGDTAHGIAIIHAIREACTGFDEFDFAFKLQYRDLDTFIHPSFKGRDDVKYVKRFEETRLSHAQFASLLDTMRKCGFKTVCTPFDEPSVDLIEAQGIEVIKIASCSLTDWPLLERIARSDKPVIASTAGATPEEVDNVVSFFLHRGKQLTIMHCVAEYPTPAAHLHIRRIDALRSRYPEVQVGFSTHEPPDETEPVMLALAKGATVFEKHVGLPSEHYSLNTYSANPAQIRNWLEAARRALTLCGSETWPAATPDSDPAWFGFPLTLKDAANVNRVDLLRYLDQYKIGTRLLFAGNITRQPYMRGRNYRIHGQLTHTDKILHDTFCIGVQPALSEEALSFVAEKLETFFNF